METEFYLTADEMLLLRLIVLVALMASPALASIGACLVPIKSLDGSEVRAVSVIGPKHNGTRLVGTGSGLFRLEGDGLLPIKLSDGSEVMWTDWNIVPDEDGTYLVGTDDGVFRQSGNVLIRIEPSDVREIRYINEIGPETDGIRLIGAGNGLFRLTGEDLTWIKPSDGGETGSVWAIGPEKDGTRLIRAHNGLFRLIGDHLAWVKPSDGSETGYILEIGSETNGARLIGTQFGLFRLKGSDLARIMTSDGSETGEVREIGPETDSTRLIGAGSGVFRLTGDHLAWIKPSDGSETGSVLEIGPEKDGTRLIRAHNGLFRLTSGDLTSVRTSDGRETQRVSEIVPEKNGTRLIGTETGLFRLTVNELNQIRTSDGRETGRILKIGPEQNGTRLIGASRGLFGMSNPILPQISRDTINTWARKSELWGFRWKLMHPCFGLMKSSDFRVVISGRDELPAEILILLGSEYGSFHVDAIRPTGSTELADLDVYLEYRGAPSSGKWKRIGGPTMLLNRAIGNPDEISKGEIETALYEQDFETALPTLLSLARKGEAWAQARLGKLYREGYGVPRDYVKALEYYRQAARQKNFNGLWGLDFMYHLEFGIRHNIATIKALHLLMDEVAKESDATHMPKNSRGLILKFFSEKSILANHLYRSDVCTPPMHDFARCALTDHCDTDELLGSYNSASRRDSCEKGEELYRLWTGNPSLIK